MEKRDGSDLQLGHLFGFEHVDVLSAGIRENVALAYNKIGEEGPPPAAAQNDASRLSMVRR